MGNFGNNMIRNKASKISTDPSQCNGCGVCMLSCPVWQQHHTKALTFCGRNRAMIGGAMGEDLASSARACILCGSCEPLCPIGIRTQQNTIDLRRSLASRGVLPIRNAHFIKQKAGTPRHTRILLPGKALRTKAELSSSILGLLGQGVGMHADDGKDIVHALESGREINDVRVEEFIAPLLKANEVIVADGLLCNFLRSLLPSTIKVLSLGQALLANQKVRLGLNASDFYIIETRAYNANQRTFVGLYDDLRHTTGCFMNLDLQRVATPTGAASYQHHEGLESMVSVEAQVRWLLEGRNAKRIVVEHLDDYEAFTKYTKLLVVHLAEVAQA
jgi:ferredoxin